MHSGGQCALCWDTWVPLCVHRQLVRHELVDVPLQAPLGHQAPRELCAAPLRRAQLLALHQLLDGGGVQRSRVRGLDPPLDVGLGDLVQRGGPPIGPLHGGVFARVGDESVQQAAREAELLRQLSCGAAPLDDRVRQPELLLHGPRLLGYRVPGAGERHSRVVCESEWNDSDVGGPSLQSRKSPTV
ncbi:hypothetical protein B484DRAFT_458425 [Ochromonadaceae sp. CCMP2298]|nr:hypothetical protein B484DRAFT_458425 [Ochromonadaceae sp. CCMP2298]|eukprot:CAMPEP_0173199956 /NCGR_PEP_ID=MMETSP1141-20130122/17521_1 /TAXON_ID=483371 /ORGANISM="non described non described, Strain CCMP2298" /LENGTH=185 /DNA_ID=CAMNT_0014124899 /DNA_START=628 /DNA_END=1185 /DNA_ORIENTATION=-